MTIHGKGESDCDCQLQERFSNKSIHYCNALLAIHDPLSAIHDDKSPAEGDEVFKTAPVHYKVTIVSQLLVFNSQPKLFPSCRTPVSSQLCIQLNSHVKT